VQAQEASASEKNQHRLTISELMILVGLSGLLCGDTEISFKNDAIANFCMENL